MCVVIAKLAGCELPDEKTLKKCFEHNPDGAGFAVSLANSVFINKGFMTIEDFLSAAKKLSKKQAIVYHFRIATSGGVSPQNCHPFPITNTVKDLTSLKIMADVALAHNGIIPIKTKKHLSDTMEFIRSILSDRAILPNLKNPAIIKLLEKYIIGSRIAILHPKNDLTLLGADWEKKNGLFFSNLYHEKTFTYFSWEDYYKDEGGETPCPVCGEDFRLSYKKHGQKKCLTCQSTFY